MMEWLGNLVSYPSWPEYLKSPFWILAVTVTLILWWLNYALGTQGHRLDAAS